MADAGYGTAQNYIYAQEHQADIIVRVTPKHFCLYNEDGEKISLVSLLKQAEDTLFCAGYVVVATSLGAEYSGEEILHLYRSRWQAKLLFKHFKQSFSITTVKAGSTLYVETLVLLQLIIWIIAEHQAFECECYLKENDENKNTIYSIYENNRIAFIQIKTILCLEWSLLLTLQIRNT